MRLYAAVDLFVMPSYSKTFGLVMREVMACGTRVAACPVGGPLEVLDPGQSPVPGASGFGAGMEPCGS